jgi:hypothetical protein
MTAGGKTPGANVVKREVFPLQSVICLAEADPIASWRKNSFRKLDVKDRARTLLDAFRSNIRAAKLINEVDLALSKF